MRFAFVIMLHHGINPDTHLATLCKWNRTWASW